MRDDIARRKAALGKDPDARASPVIHASPEMPARAIARRGLDRKAVSDAPASGEFDTAPGTIRLQDDQPKDLWRVCQRQGPHFVGMAPVDRAGAAAPLIRKPARNRAEGARDDALHPRRGVGAGRGLCAGRLGRGPRPDAGGGLRDLARGAAAAPERAVRMANPSGGSELGPAVFGVAGPAAAPLFTGDHAHDPRAGVMSAATLASAWALFSGPTKCVSLATEAFFGLGACTVAVLGGADRRRGGSGPVVALLAGLATPRLAGVCVVIFTFGLAELLRRLVTRFETVVTHRLGRYVFVDVASAQIYWMLLGPAALALRPRRVVMRAGEAIADGPTAAAPADPAVIEACLGRAAHV